MSIYPSVRIRGVGIFTWIFCVFFCLWNVLVCSSLVMVFRLSSSQLAADPTHRHAQPSSREEQRQADRESERAARRPRVRSEPPAGRGREQHGGTQRARHIISPSSVAL